MGSLFLEKASMVPSNFDLFLKDIVVILVASLIILSLVHSIKEKVRSVDSTSK